MLSLTTNAQRTKVVRKIWCVRASFWKRWSNHRQTAGTFWPNQERIELYPLLAKSSLVIYLFFPYTPSYNTLELNANKARLNRPFPSCLASENSRRLATLPGTGFPAKWRLRNECRNSILMTWHYPDLASASDWSCRVGNLIQLIRSNTQICVVTRHQYGISALVSQTLFGGETRDSVAKCRLFSQATSCPKQSLSGQVLSWSCKGIQESRGFWIPGTEFRLCQWNLDSEF